jgi:uncharacterized small protein (DUF1192 family)
MSKNLRRTSRRAKTKPNQISTVKEGSPSKAAIDELDQEIAALKSEVSKLQAKLHDLEQKRASYAYQISPLRRIPTEILSEIIRLCLDDGEDIIKIAGVCGRLREVALGMTEVWSKITLQPVKSSELFKVPIPVKGQYGFSVQVCRYRICHSLCTYREAKREGSGAQPGNS